MGRELFESGERSSQSPVGGVDPSMGYDTEREIALRKCNRQIRACGGIGCGAVVGVGNKVVCDQAPGRPCTSPDISPPEAQI